MRFVINLKKGFKYVLLSLCVLAMVFQPVTSFASSNYTYNAITSLLYNWTFSVGDMATVYHTNINIDDDIDNPYEYALFYGYQYFENDNYFYSVRIVEVGGDYSMAFRAFPIADFTLARPSIPSNSIYFFANKSSHVYVSNFIIDLDNYRESIEENLDPVYTNVNQGNWFYVSTTANPGHVSFNMLTPPNGFTVSSSPNRSMSSSTYTPVNYFTLSYSSEDYYNPSLPSSNVMPPTSPDVNNEMFYWWLNSNFYYRDGQSALNQGYTPVGRFLTYNMLAMDNPDQNTITVDGIDYHNWYYDLSQSLAYIIASMPSAANISSIASNLDSIDERLETAFPDDQVEMNDSIAQQVLDDSNGKGLTVSKITSTKSTLDDGVDAFEVDSSGISWSSPFEALFYLDWAWFSTETANHLQVQDEGSLQNDIDYSGLQYYNSVNSYYDDGY